MLDILLLLCLLYLPLRFLYSKIRNKNMLFQQRFLSIYVSNDCVYYTISNGYGYFTEDTMMYEVENVYSKTPFQVLSPILHSSYIKNKRNEGYDKVVISLATKVNETIIDPKKSNIHGLVNTSLNTPDCDDGGKKEINVWKDYNFSDIFAKPCYILNSSKASNYGNDQHPKH